MPLGPGDHFLGIGFFVSEEMGILIRLLKADEKLSSQENLSADSQSSVVISPQCGTSRVCPKALDPGCGPTVIAFRPIVGRHGERLREPMLTLFHQILY